MKSIQEINCKNWKEFDKKVVQFIQPKDFIYRGQGNSLWPLQTSFQRFFQGSLKTMPTPSDPDPFEILINKYASFLGNKDRKYSDYKTDDFVNLGQHFGLPTPYLDWTKTIYKAAFFACCEEAINPGAHDAVAVYALKVHNIDMLTSNQAMKKLILDNKGFKLFEKHGLKLENPVKSADNSRIDAQDGLFSYLSGTHNFKYDLIDFFEQEIYSVYRFDKPIIYRFKIPKIESKHILLDLNLKSGINFSSIYPDKEGYAKQAKMEFLFDI